MSTMRPTWAVRGQGSRVAHLFVPHTEHPGAAMSVCPEYWWIAKAAELRPVGDKRKCSACQHAAQAMRITAEVL